MARKIAEDKGKKKSKSEFQGFVNIELTLEEKAEAKQWIRDVEAVQVELDELMARGYKVTIVKSEATGGYQASAFCTDIESPNAGYILSAFAPSWYDALCMLVYKHAIHAEGIWPIGEISRDLWG